jgi:hypothetical protein
VRLRIPEIVLGVLLAIAVFGMGMLFGSSDYQPTHETTNQSTDQIARGHKPEPFTIDWLTHDGTVFFTFVLAMIAGAQAALFLWQLRYMKRGMLDAKTAADAAKVSADATALSTRASIALQLPLIRIRPDELGHGDGIRIGGERYEECFVGSVIICNLGTTKAFPIEILYGWTIGDELPPEPNYQYADRFLTNLIIEPNPKITPRKKLTMASPLKDGEWAKICSGNYCWFYVAFHFNDFMDEPHSSGFCWRWASNGIGMRWIEDRTPAYNRKT